MAKRGPRPVRVSDQPERTDDAGAMGASTDDGARTGAARADHFGVRGGPSDTGDRAELRITRQTVGAGVGAFLQKRLDGLVDEPRPGTPRRLTDAQVEQVIIDTLEKTAARRDPVEHPDVGEGARAQSRHGRPHLARVRPAAASQ